MARAYPLHWPEQLIVHDLTDWNEVQMGSIDFQIAALHGGSASQAAENAHVPQAQPASPVLPAREVPAAPPAKAQQDTVSLSGTPPQRQQSSASRGNAQPATFQLLAQTTTFPPTQSSIPAVAASAVPSAATQPASQNNVAAAVVQSNAGTQTSVATATATANAPAVASPASASNAAPAQQTLQQLDRVLQQLGIDPQTLSLISREGMLNWVNDPAALRQIVQNVQAAANSSQQNDAVGAANPTRSTAQLAVANANANANQDQIQPQTQSQPQASAQETNPASGSSSAASSANTNALGQSAATAQQNATAVMQFQKLQDSLAPSGAAETQPAASPGGTTTQQGQLLNVSA
jgi:hypothetical protein